MFATSTELSDISRHLDNNQMPSQSTASKGPIQLHYSGGQVIVTPEDEDRFVMGSAHAVSACKNDVAFRRFAASFREEFLGRLHGWCKENKHLVLACYVPIALCSAGPCIKVFVVARSTSFDFGLSDRISNLETEFCGKDWPADILQVASGTSTELEAFFDPSESIQVFADAND